MTTPVDHTAQGLGWREHSGAGPVLLALHGIGSRARGFDALAACLPDWRVIAWDAPGYGASDPLTQNWPLAGDYAQALARLLDRLELARVHVLGHSLGTLIGAAFARAHPDRVAGLVLASCAQGGGVSPGSDLPPVHATRLTDLQTLGAAAFAASRAPRLVHKPDENPDLVAEVAGGMACVRLPGYAQAVRMLASGDLAADCARLVVPCAVVVGAEDIVTPPAQSQRAHAALPIAQRGALTLVPGAGHALPQQAPAALAAAIDTHAQRNCAQQENRI